MARFFVYDEQSEISITPGGIALPVGSAFMLPGLYLVNGVSYDCRRPGLYRWWDPTGCFINRIVWKGQDGSLDVYATVSAISWNHTHGIGTEYGFDDAALQAMSNAGRSVKWSARCGYIASMCAWLLPLLGVQARTVNVSTIGTKNGYDDGHIVLETRHGNDWRMWDLTSGCYFRNSSGKHMSTLEVVAWLSANQTGMPEIVYLDGDRKYSHDAVSVPAGALDMGLWWEWMLSSPSKAEAWYRRIFQSIV